MQINRLAFSITCQSCDPKWSTWLRRVGCTLPQEARVSGRLGTISGFAEDSDDENLDDLMQDGSMEYNHTSF